MSVVAAVVEEAGVRMASDSQATSDHARDAGPKIERMSCGALVGITGSPLWHTFLADWKEDLTHLEQVRTFALAWVRWAIQQGTAVEDGMPIGCLLVATNGQLFQVCNDGAVLVIRDYIAVGSGAGFAMGALYAQSRNSRRLDGTAVGHAIEAAIYFDPFCGGPVHQLHTIAEVQS